MLIYYWRNDTTPELMLVSKMHSEKLWHTRQVRFTVYKIYM